MKIGKKLAGQKTLRNCCWKLDCLVFFFCFCCLTTRRALVI